MRIPNLKSMTFFESKAQVALIIEAILFSPQAKSSQILRAYPDSFLEPAGPNPCMPQAGNRFEHLILCNLYLFRISNFGFRVYARYASQFTLHENEIQSTNYYVRNYQRIMQNKPNLVRRRRIENELKVM